MVKIDLKARFLKQFQGLPEEFKKGPLYLAVSGGMDSTVLAHVAWSLREKLPPLRLLHVNYHLRLPDSDREEKFLREWARQRKLPFHVKRLYPKQKPNNLQAWARHHRLKFFIKVLGEAKDKNAIVTLGHHRRDQVETILLRLLGGAGWHGLGSMSTLETLKVLDKKAITPPLLLFRPWLQLPYESLAAYAKKHRIKFCQDQSNFELGYLRNRIRNQLLPWLMQENPRIEEALVQLASQGKEGQGALDQLAEEWLKTQGWPRRKRLSRKSFQGLPLALGGAVLNHWLRQSGGKTRGGAKLHDQVLTQIYKLNGTLDVPLNPDKKLKLSKKTLSIISSKKDKV